MNLITRKSECKRLTEGTLVKSKKEITKKVTKEVVTKYSIVVKPFHASILPYKEIVFRGVTFSDDFSIELVRNSDLAIAENGYPDGMPENIFHFNGRSIFKKVS